MKKHIIVIVCIVAILATTSLAFAYYGSKRERIVSEQKDGKALVMIPEGITKIRIVSGKYGDVVTIDGDDTAAFLNGLMSIEGKVKYTPEGTGYEFGVHCYRGDERILTFSFTSETTIRENMGDGTDRWFTANEAIPAYTQVEELFAILGPQE